MNIRTFNGKQYVLITHKETKHIAGRIFFLVAPFADWEIVSVSDDNNWLELKAQTGEQVRICFDPPTFSTHMTNQYYCKTLDTLADFWRRHSK